VVTERGHGENARENALIVSINETPKTSKASYAEDFDILD